MATPMGKESSLLSVTGNSARLESSSSQDSQLFWKKEQVEEDTALLRAFSSTVQIGEEKKEPHSKKERSRAHLSFRRGTFLLNKVGFKTQTVVDSVALTPSAHVTSKQLAQPGLRGQD